MKHKRKILLGISLVLIGMVVLSGLFLFRGGLSGHMQFDTALYAKVNTISRDRPFSYHDYAAVLKRFVDKNNMVAYDRLKNNHQNLDNFLLTISQLPLKEYQAWAKTEKTAFWINAYNALTLKVIIDHYPIKARLFSGWGYPANSIRQIRGAWNKINFLVLGQKLTLNQIEHGILRSQDKKLSAKYGKFHEPRIHMALVCAAQSCPPLRIKPYIGSKLDKQLYNQAQVFLANQANFRINRKSAKIYLSSIFKWFGNDFRQKYKPDKGFASGKSDAVKAVLNFVSRYLPADQAEYLRTGKYDIAYLDYNWSLNEQHH